MNIAKVFASICGAPVLRTWRTLYAWSNGETALPATLRFYCEVGPTRHTPSYDTGYNDDLISTKAASTDTESTDISLSTRADSCVVFSLSVTPREKTISKLHGLAPAPPPGQTPRSKYLELQPPPPPVGNYLFLLPRVTRTHTWEETSFSKHHGPNTPSPALHII